MGEIESVFSLADVNSDGEICYDEFVAMMFPAAASALAKFRKHHRTLKNAKHAFDSYDVDGDGKISFLEFSKIMIPSCQDTLTKFWKCFRNVQGVRETFKKFDADGDAQISRQEVIQGASSSGMKMSADEVDTLFILGDKNGDGAIDFAEFAEIMIPSAPERIAKLKKCFRNRTEIEAAFRRFDTNKDGAISFQEMKNGLS